MGKDDRANNKTWKLSLTFETTATTRSGSLWRYTVVDDLLYRCQIIAKAIKNASGRCLTIESEVWSSALTPFDSDYCGPEKVYPETTQYDLMQIVELV